MPAQEPLSINPDLPPSRAHSHRPRALGFGSKASVLCPELPWDHWDTTFPRPTGRPVGETGWAALGLSRAAVHCWCCTQKLLLWWRSGCRGRSAGGPGPSRETLGAGTGPTARTDLVSGGRRHSHSSPLLSFPGFLDMCAKFYTLPNTFYKFERKKNYYRNFLFPRLI